MTTKNEDFLISVIIPVYNQEVLVKRAIESIPEEAEIIVVNDCSTDNTLNTLLEYKNITILNNEENKGVGYTVNKGLDIAKGKYITFLGSDDFFYEEVNDVIKQLDETDIVYYNLINNEGMIYELNQDTKFDYCGSTKFIKREFIGQTRCPEIRYAEDQQFYNDLIAKQPTEKFTNIIAKHYNYPRIDSLTNLKQRGVE
ncbi:MAG: glycosyltransferase family 2 protein [Bacilli bacterium]|nr:glycosyltransferase family 2 protein [Bacilli bacterium]